DTVVAFAPSPLRSPWSTSGTPSPSLSGRAASRARISGGTSAHDAYSWPLTLMDMAGLLVRLGHDGDRDLGPGWQAPRDASRIGPARRPPAVDLGHASPRATRPARAGHGRGARRVGRV